MSLFNRSINRTSRIKFNSYKHFTKLISRELWCYFSKLVLSSSIVLFGLILYLTLLLLWGNAVQRLEWFMLQALTWIIDNFWKVFYRWMKELCKHIALIHLSRLNLLINICSSTLFGFLIFSSWFQSFASFRQHQRNVNLDQCGCVFKYHSLTNSSIIWWAIFCVCSVFLLHHQSIN